MKIPRTEWFGVGHFIGCVAGIFIIHFSKAGSVGLASLIYLGTLIPVMFITMHFDNKGEE